jgi:hypothetical protein
MEVVIAVKAKDDGTPVRSHKQFLTDQVSCEQRRLEKLADTIMQED